MDCLITKFTLNSVAKNDREILNSVSGVSYSFPKFAHGAHTSFWRAKLLAACILHSKVKYQVQIPLSVILLQIFIDSVTFSNFSISEIKVFSTKNSIFWYVGPFLLIMYSFSELTATNRFFSKFFEENCRKNKSIFQKCPKNKIYQKVWHLM